MLSGGRFSAPTVNVEEYVWNQEGMKLPSTMIYSGKRSL